MKTITLDWVEYELVLNYICPWCGTDTKKLDKRWNWTPTVKWKADFYCEPCYLRLRKPLHWEIDLSDKDTND